MKDITLLFYPSIILYKQNISKKIQFFKEEVETIS
jgi:hypothetical protein